MSDYLANTRNKSLEDDSKISEAELHASDPNIQASWQDIQDLKRVIAKRKQEASAAIDAELGPQLKELEGHYALIITMTR